MQSDYTATREQEKLSSAPAVNSIDVASQDESASQVLGGAAAPAAGQRQSQDVSYYNFHGHLAQFRSIGEHREHWEERWSRKQIRESLETAATGKLDEFEDLFTRYLPRDLPVLEAGCGKGHLVMALDRRGYRVEGLDYAAQTIALLHEVAPEINTRVGDVYNLDAQDGAYGGYISIGIFEHNPEGPQKGLSETRRVLDPRGVALISVPYLNNQRHKLLSSVPVVEDVELSNGLRFYQYYYARDDFERYLREAGLEVIRVCPYAVYSALTRDFNFGQWLHYRRFFNWRIHRRVTRWCRESPEWVGWRWAHMIMFVCKPA